MPQVPLNIVNKEIDTFGELVTLTVLSSQTYSDYGDETAVETDITSVKAVFNVYRSPTKFEREGTFEDGDLAFFFKSDQTNLDRGNKITRTNGDVYEIDDPRDHGTEGNVIVNEVRVKKI